MISVIRIFRNHSTWMEQTLAQRLKNANFEKTIIEQEYKDCLNKAVMNLISEIVITKCRMVIIRGIPGSGKTTLAMSLRNYLEGAVICEADNFMGPVFNVNKLNSCHQECQKLARIAIKKNNIAIISNTNTTLGEMEIYRKIAVEEGVLESEIKVVEPFVSWKYNITKCMAVGTHKSIPKNILEKHLNNLISEPTTPDILIRMRGVKLL